MNIQPSEIDSIEEAGTLDQSPVKLLRTKGGLWIALGKPKGSSKESALGAGSHPAIVKFNLKKQYPDFQPMMMKSEYLSESTVVDKHSHFLSSDLRKSGHEIYSIQKGNEVEFHITKDNKDVAVINSSFDTDSIVVKNMKADKKFARALAGATTEKAMSCGIKKVKLQGN